MRVTIAFDYGCGYSYKLYQFVQALLEAGEPLEPDWRPYSLDQNDNVHGQDWYVWEHPEEFTVSFSALAAGRFIALEYPPEVFARYHGAAFAARHDGHRSLDRDTAVSLAVEAGADEAAIEAALDGGEAAKLVAADHLEFRDRLGVFGTPTVVFPDEAPVFVRLKGQWSGGDHARETWSRIRTFHDEPLLNELKRPPTWKPAELLDAPARRPTA